MPDLLIRNIDPHLKRQLAEALASLTAAACLKKRRMLPSRKALVERPDKSATEGGRNALLELPAARIPRR